MEKSLLGTTLGFLITYGASMSANAENLKERSDWQQILSDHAVRGVVTVCDAESNLCQTSDLARANARYSPASTFKIPHLLIALDTGVLSPTKTLFPWDGKPQALKIWERDVSLRGTLQYSVVPIYQDFARHIGAQRMQQRLQDFSYGNADTSGGIDRFWLDGKLQISALEQIHFLKHLQSNTLPIATEHQLRVKDAMLTEATDQYVLRSKTGYGLGMPGYGDSTRPSIGWWVGWIEKDTRTHFFACNFDIESESQLPLRKQIPTQILTNEALLPAKP